MSTCTIIFNEELQCDMHDDKNCECMQEQRKRLKDSFEDNFKNALSAIVKYAETLHNQSSDQECLTDEQMKDLYERACRNPSGICCDLVISEEAKKESK